MESNKTDRPDDTSSDIKTNQVGDTSLPAASDDVSEAEAILRIKRDLSISSKFSGPLPPPNVLRAYGMINQDFPERIFRMAEQQAQHRMSLEKVVVEGDVKRANWGLLAAFVIAASCLGSGTFLIFKGHDWAGAGVVGASAATLVGTFIYGSNNRTQERAKKERMLLEGVSQSDRAQIYDQEKEEN